MSGFGQRLSNTEATVLDLQTSVEFVSAQYGRPFDVHGKVNTVEQSLNDVQNENAILKETLL